MGKGQTLLMEEKLSLAGDLGRPVGKVALELSLEEEAREEP